MFNVKEIKKEIEDFEIQDLVDIIRTEPLIAGINSTLIYNKKQRKELKSCLLEIAKRTLDLAELEKNFLFEDIKNRTITIETDKELKELLKNILTEKLIIF